MYLSPRIEMSSDGDEWRCFEDDIGSVEHPLPAVTIHDPVLLRVDGEPGRGWRAGRGQHQHHRGPGDHAAAAALLTSDDNNVLYSIITTDNRNLKQMCSFCVYNLRDCPKMTLQYKWSI